MKKGIPSIHGIAIPDKPVLDKETGELVSFSREDVELLLVLETQAQNAYIQLGTALKTIRDRRLFLLRGSESFKEYTESYLSQSYRHTKRLVFVADKITTDSEGVQKLSFNELYEIAKKADVAEKVNSGEIQFEDGKVILPDGEEYSVKSFIKRIRGEVEEEFEKEKRKIESTKVQIKGFKREREIHVQQMEEKDSEIEKLKAAIDAMAQTKDIDPAVLVFARTKDDMRSLIDSCMERALRAISEMERMPRDAVDAEIAGKLVLASSAIKAALEHLQNMFHEAIYAASAEVE